MAKLTRRAALAGAALLPLARPALAQGPWAPSRPVRLLVGFPPGGGADILGRRLAEALSPALGQPVVVENRAGAGAQIAVDAVAKSAPDGHVIGLSPLGPLTVNAVLRPGQLPYDPAIDFTMLAHVWDQPNLLVGSLAVPARWPEFLPWLRVRPEENFASVGPGTSNHLTGELLSRALGLRLQHVPYRGTPAALTDILAGRINLFVDNIQGSMELAKDGKVRALAVTTERRAEVLPDVPSMAELGLPDVTVSSWQVMVGPARLPPAIADRLSQELDKVIRAPEMVRWMASIGAQAAGNGRAAAEAMVARERERWARVIPAMNIRLN
jgi:tripartite-type tricarboxylate transporter receptor subunit TctC